MDNDHSITSDICAITGNNLEAVLFPDYHNQDSMIVTSDGIGNLSSLEGALCYDETTNEFVYVNMIQQNLNGADSLSAVSQSVFSALGGSSTSLADISTFGDGGQVMLLTNGSIVVPNDDDNPMIENSNPFVLEFVRDPPDSAKPTDSNSKSTSKLPEFGKPAKPDFSSSIVEFPSENEDRERLGNEVAKNKKPVEIDYLDDELLIGNKKGTRYHCKLCSKKFSHLKEYRIHLLDHKDKMHKCSYCANSFNKLKNLILHEAIHNPVDTMCPLSNCRKKFKRLASLKAHIKLHEEEETLTCSECGEEFRNQLYLELHYKYQPQCRVSAVEPAVVNVKSLSCKLCNRKFQDTNTLAAHKKEHEKIKKALAAKNYRKRPVISVPSSRINRCKECTKWFLKPSQLVRHMRIHTGERPFECTECDKAFNQANSLKIHMLKHTGDRPYLCQFCHSGFSQRGNLRQHINRVHSIPKVEEHVYECSECPCIFKKMCSLNAHRNRVHQKRYYVSQNQEKSWSLNVSNMKSPVDNQPRNSINDNDDGDNVDKATLNGAFQKQYSRKSPLPGLLTAGESPTQSRSKTERELEYRCPECPRVFEKSCSLNTHLHQIHQKQQPGSSAGEVSENSITIENGLDDLNDEDVDLLLQRQTAVNTITISVDKGNGELWNQKVFITKKRNTRYYQCSHCPKQSIKLNEIIRHLKLNMMGKLFKCDYCTKTFSQHSIFLTHLTLHATAKMYECSVCQQSFSNPAELKMHSKNHVKAQNDYMCMICFKSYSPNDIANHQCLPSEQVGENADLRITESRKGPLESASVQRVHDKISLILPPYNCRYCNVTFDSYSKLKMHLHEHDANLCEICCLLFPSKEKLKEHAISHKEEDMKDLICKLCDKKFRTKRQCDVHLKAHLKNRQGKTGENKCSMCGKVCKDPTALKRHLKKMHVSELEMSMNPKNSEIESVSSTKFECNTVLPLKEVSAQDVLNSEPVDIQSTTIEFITNGDSSVSTVTVDTTQPVCEDIPIETAVCAFEDAILCDSKEATNTVVVGDATLARNLLENSDAITLPNRTNLPDLLTIDSLEDCFLNVQGNGLPLESEIDSVPSVYSLPGAIIYKCTKCSQQYSTELDLQKHFQESEVCNNGMLNTAVSYFYACNTCYLTFKSLESFLKHLQTHDGNRTFLCLYCGTLNRTEAELTQHIAQHSLNKEYPCLHCGELSSSAESVKKHITDIHLMSSAETKTSETKRKKNAGNELLLSEREKLMLVCQKPNKFSSISERVLSSLLKEGTDKGARGKDDDDSCDGNKSGSKTKKKSLSSVGAKENTCSYCGRVFKKMSDLIRHVRIHTGEKPFKCDYCNKCFTVKSILNCHLKTHFTVKNICCHICNRFFATVGSLKIHMRLHTGDRPYQCLYCKETFRTSGHRESHQKRHLGERDKAKATNFIVPEMIEIGNDDCLNLPLAEDINLEDSDFILPDITDSEFQGLDLGDLNNPPVSKTTSFDCSVCGKLFGRRWDLKQHMNVHFPERGYNCTICDAKFNQQYALKQHLRRHIPLPAVVCDVCHKNFASSANLKVHKVRLHPETLNLPVQDVNESESPPPHDEIPVQTSTVVSDAGGSMSDSDRDPVRWADQGDLSLSILVGKNKKTDSLNDFFIIEKQFDLNSMMSDLFPDDDK